MNYPRKGYNQGWDREEGWKIETENIEIIIRLGMIGEA